MEARRKNEAESVAGTGERRNNLRRPERGSVRLVVETPSIEGRAENVSPTGILFHSDGELKVSVEVEEDGVAIRRTGRLVRVQRMRGERFGWAIEFD